MRAETFAVFPAVRRHRQLDEERLAHSLAQIERPTIMKLHVIVALELDLVAPASGARPVCVQLERNLEGQLEALETANAFQPRGRSDHTSDRDPITASLDLEIAADEPRPLPWIEPDLGRFRLWPNAAGPLG